MLNESLLQDVGTISQDPAWSQKTLRIINGFAITRLLHFVASSGCCTYCDYCRQQNTKICSSLSPLKSISVFYNQIVRGVIMRRIILAVIVILLSAVPLMAAEGVIMVQSNFEVKETADRMEKILKEKGMTIFNRINHSEGARSVGIEIRDTELLIFGNPKVGSALMKCQQIVAIDLPLKALIWKDDTDAVFISYNDPGYLQSRHNVSGCDDVFTKVGKALATITQAASSN